MQQQQQLSTIRIFTIIAHRNRLMVSILGSSTGNNKDQKTTEISLKMSSNQKGKKDKDKEIKRILMLI